MVILGGLELVAAGVILHKYNKGKEQELQREQERRARERRHDRKHHPRRHSPPRHNRKESSQYFPQGQVPRPQSAPPPGYAPNWQPVYYPPQPWQPQQNDKTPAWQPQPNNYPPTWQAQAPSQSPSLPKPQPRPSMNPTSLHDDAALSELLQNGPAQASNQQSGRPQPRPTATAPPDANYAELSADSPGRHNTNPNARPHVSFVLPGEESPNIPYNDPPPAYQDYQP